MSWNAVSIEGLELVSGADLSQIVRYFSPPPEVFCPGGEPGGGTWITLVSMTGSMNADSTYAADHIAELAAYDLVQVFTTGGGSGGTLGGWFDCEDFHTHLARAGSYATVNVSGGPSAELRETTDGTLRPILNPFQANFTPITDGLFMRPTALAWAGQDPDNSANRSVWLPSELIGVLGEIDCSQSYVQAGGHDSYFGTGVRAFNVIDGSPYEPATEEPVICFV